MKKTSLLRLMLPFASLFLFENAVGQELTQRYVYMDPPERYKMTGFDKFFSAAERMLIITSAPALNIGKDVAGPDVNGNGIRDDLDAYIASLPDTEANKKAMTKGFAAYQLMITTDKKNRELIEYAVEKTSGALGEMINVFGPVEAFSRLKIIDSYSLNTVQRRLSYDDFEVENIKRLEDLGETLRLNRDRDIAGPDADGNGVRDDLDDYVASLSDNELQKKAATQYIAAYQQAITIDFKNLQEVEEALGKINDAKSCIEKRYGEENGIKKSRIFDRYLFNTGERFEASQMFKISRHGIVLKVKYFNYCIK